MAGISFYRENTDNHPIRTFIIWCVDILVVIALAVMLVGQIFNSVKMSGRAMEPGMINGDRLMMSKIKPSLIALSRFDLVVFTPDGDEEKELIRRVTGLPGERIRIEEGVIYINDEPLEDPYTGAITIAGLAENEIELGGDEYFVMGDNVNNSEDSRFSYIGNVKEEHIEGVVWFRYGPIDRLSPVK